VFMVVIGGLGTVEGPILGALIFFGLQQTLSGYGPWYLVLLGAVATGVTLFLPRGLWGTLAADRGVALFPLGYQVARVTLKQNGRTVDPDAAGPRGGGR
jgi:branched-chain amino acid transport system permease protein